MAEIIQDGNCGDNLTWELDDNGTLTISGTGAMNNWSSSNNAPWYEYFGKIINVVIDNGVTSIGNYAFKYCYNLTSVIIGNSVSSIGEGAFYYCDSLTSINIPDSVTSIGDWVFSNCDSLTSLTIGNSVTSIGKYAFEHCISLTSINVPNSVTSIGNYVFYDCYNLISINVDENNPSYSSIDGNLFNKEKTILYQYAIGKTATTYTIPDGVTSIGDGAFGSCSSLTRINIPDRVISIGSYAFYYCISLTSINIPENITEINEHTFANCESLKSITIPKNVTIIGEYAFYGCSNLIQIIFLKKDEKITINSYAFEQCTKLTDVYYEGTEEEWNDINYVNISENNFCLKEATFHFEMINAGTCGNLTWVITSRGVFSVLGTGDMPQWDDNETDSIPWKDTIEQITSVEVGDNITSISKNAFFGGINIKTVYISDNIRYYGEKCFGEKEEIVIYYKILSQNINNLESLSNYAEKYNYIVKIMYSDGQSALNCMKFIKQNNLDYELIPFKSEEIFSIDLDNIRSATIGKYAFLNRDIKSIIIPETITEIGKGILKGCTKLEEITIPFIGRSKTEKGTEDARCNYFGWIFDVSYEDVVNMNDYMQEYSNINLITITSANLVESVILSGNLTTGIPDYAFCGYKYLKQIILPNNFEQLGTKSFYQIGNNEDTEETRAPLEIILSPFLRTLKDNCLFTTNQPLNLIWMTLKTYKDEANNIGGALDEEECILNSATINQINGYYYSDENGNKFIKEESIVYVEDDSESEGYPLKVDGESVAYSTLAYGISKRISISEKFIENNTPCGDNLFYEVVEENNIKILKIKGAGAMWNFTTTSSPFKKIENINKIVFEGNCTSIGDYAFCNMTTLKEINFSDSIQQIGGYAFYNCPALQIVKLNSKVKKIPLYCFENCVSLLTINVENIQEIGAYSFNNCQALTELNLTDKLTILGSYAFRNSGLISLIIPDSICTMGCGVVSSCGKLNNLQTPIFNSEHQILWNRGSVLHLFDEVDSVWETKHDVSDFFSINFPNLNNYGSTDNNYYTYRQDGGRFADTYYKYAWKKFLKNGDPTVLPRNLQQLIITGSESFIFSPNTNEYYLTENDAGRYGGLGYIKETTSSFKIIFRDIPTSVVDKYMSDNKYTSKYHPNSEYYYTLAVPLYGCEALETAETLSSIFSSRENKSELLSPLNTQDIVLEENLEHNILYAENEPLYSDTEIIEYDTKVLEILANKEYAWKAWLYGNNYDVYVTDNNTYADGSSYLPYLYVPNNSRISENQQLSLIGEKTYNIDNISTFKYTNKIFYRQSKGILSGSLSYFNTTTGLVKYNTENQTYEIMDTNLKNSLTSTPVNFTIGSSYDSSHIDGTICVDNGVIKVEVKGTAIQNANTITIEKALVTKGSIDAELANMVGIKSKQTGNVENKEIAKFTTAVDGQIQTITSIENYYEVTFSPGFYISSNGYNKASITLADEMLVLPNDLLTNTIVVVANTKGKLTIIGNYGENVQKGTVSDNLIGLIQRGLTSFELNINNEIKTYLVVDVDRDNNEITFVGESEKGILIENSEEFELEISLKNYIDMSSSEFDKTDLHLTLNYINIYDVENIEKYELNDFPLEDGEELYLITTTEVINPTDFEVDERLLEKEMTLERYSTILTISELDGVNMQHTIVPPNTFYEIKSNYIETPQFYFQTANKQDVVYYLNGDEIKNEEGDEITKVIINSSSAQIKAVYEGDLSWYKWELQEEIGGEYYTIKEFTNQYGIHMDFNYDLFESNTNYKLILTIYTQKDLKVVSELYLKVEYEVIKAPVDFVISKDCDKKAIKLDFGTLNYDLYELEKYIILRKNLEEDSIWCKLAEVNNNIKSFYDYSFNRENTYEYFVVPIWKQEGKQINGIPYKVEASIHFNLKEITLVETDIDDSIDQNNSLFANIYKANTDTYKLWTLLYNTEANDVSIVTDKTIYETTTKLPVVNKTERNYKTGTVKAFIGGFEDGKNGWSYKDSIKLQNKLQAFCDSGKVKMLRDEIGNVVPVDVTLNSFTYNPLAIPSNITVTFEWTQVGEEDNLSVWNAEYNE